jgi:TfoX/Sxy family transcriptional regulator of competence genes
MLLSPPEASTEYALLSAGSRATRARPTAAAPLAEGARRSVRPGAGISGAVEATVRSLPAGFSARTIAAVTYDEDLAARLRELVGGEETLTEQKMFGGLAFLISGNMAVSASGQGGLMVRVDPAKSDELVATTPARPVEMRGRSTRGWLRVSTEDLRTERELAKWVALGTTYARSLPAKR